MKSAKNVTFDGFWQNPIFYAGLDPQVISPRRFSGILGICAIMRSFMDRNHWKSIRIQQSKYIW